MFGVLARGVVPVGSADRSGQAVAKESRITRHKALRESRFMVQTLHYNPESRNLEVLENVLRGDYSQLSHPRGDL